MKSRSKNPIKVTGTKVIPDTSVMMSNEKLLTDNVEINVELIDAIIS